MRTNGLLSALVNVVLMDQGDKTAVFVCPVNENTVGAADVSRSS